MKSTSLKINRELNEDCLKTIDSFKRICSFDNDELFVEIFNIISENPIEEDDNHVSVITVKALQFASMGENIGKFNQMDLLKIFDTYGFKDFNESFYTISSLAKYKIGINTVENFNFLTELNILLHSFASETILTLIKNSIYYKIIEKLDFEKYFDFWDFMYIKDFLQDIKNENDICVAAEKIQVFFKTNKIM